MIRYDCGCVNDVDRGCFAQFNIFKCKFHKDLQREVGELGESYYAEMGATEAQQDKYELEFLNGFVSYWSPTDGRSNRLLEVGCGMSLYVSLLESLGWVYEGVEPSRFAADWLRRTHDVEVEVCRLDQSTSPNDSFGAVLSAHSLEHMDDPRGALETMRDRLESGGLLLLLIPDDTDLWNPDHLWFFSPSTIRRLLTQVGFEVLSLNFRRHVEKENYIYVTARKP